MKKRLYLKFIAIIVLAVLAGLVAHPDGRINLTPLKVNFDKQYDLKLGLDLQGGTHLVYEGDLKDIPQDAQVDAMNSARDVIERRVNGFGVSEPLVQLSGNNRIIVELPGINDINEAIKLIGQTPFLEFKEESSTPPQHDAEGNINIE